MLSDNNLAQKVSFPPRAAPGRATVAANFVSTLFSPALTVSYGAVLISSSMERPLILLWTFFFMVLFVLPPTMYILYLMKKKKVADFHMSIRKERIRPLCVIFVYTLFSIFLYGHVAGGPTELVVMGLSGLVAVGFVALISFYWKVSGHCAAVGGLMVVALHFHDNLVFALPIVLLVAWSRIRLGCHSFSQTLAGFALGFAVFFGFFIL